MLDSELDGEKASCAYSRGPILCIFDHGYIHIYVYYQTVLLWNTEELVLSGS
jgi:hypothetical protein